MLFMVVERFKGRDPKPIYRRLRDEGRLLQRWVAGWSDLMEMEIVPVALSADVRAMMEPLL